MKLFSTVYLSAILFLTSGCDSQQSVVPATSSSPSPNSTENSMIYLFFEIEKTAGNTEKITHTETKIAKGILKSASVENEERLPGNLIITVLGTDDNILEERIIEDPLNPILESYSEEGLNKQKMNFPKAEFSVRFNQKGNASSVKIEKITASSKNHLITIKL